MASSVARGVSITVKAKNGQTGFTPTPPAPPSVSCAYPLDAPQGEILAAGYDGRLTTSDGDQTVEYLIQSQLAGLFDWAAAPVNTLAGTGQKFDYSAPGKKAVEIQPLNLPTIVDGAVSAEVAIAVPNLSTIYSLRVGSNLSEGFFISAVSGFTPGVIAQNLPSPPTSVAIVYDKDANQIYIRYNGVNYQTTAANLTDVIMVASGTEFANVGAGDTGKAVRWRAETNASKLLGSFESGTTDPCGNLIS